MSDGIDVLVTGLGTIDYVLGLDEPLPAGGKAFARSLSVYAGGGAANAAYTLAALGLRVRFVGCFGSDDAGRLGWDSLAAVGCDLAGSVVVPDCPHNFSAITVDTRTGERSVVAFADPRMSLPAQTLTPQLFRHTRAFYTDGTESASTLRGLQLARARCVLTVADMEHNEAWWADALRWLDELIAPSETLCELAADTSCIVRPRPLRAALQAISQRGPQVVIGTAGSHGCTAFLAAPTPTTLRVAAQPIDAIDTTGAGDAFHAGYLAARLSGLAPPETLEFASVVAAACCLTPGPRAALDRLYALAPGIR